MSSTNVSVEISEAQSALDAFAEDGSVQEGAYIELSNHLKKIKEKKQEDMQQEKREFLAEYILNDPTMMQYSLIGFSVLDIELADAVFKHARAKYDVDETMFYILLESYGRMIFQWSTDDYDQKERMEAFVDITKLLTCKEKLLLCKTLEHTEQCVVCTLMFDEAYPEDLTDSFISAIQAMPRLVVNYDKCPDKKDHPKNLSSAVRVAQESACACNWADAEFVRVVGRKRLTVCQECD